MSRPSADPAHVTRSHADYGSFVICESCSRQSDIWTEQCACGFELLPDDRKVKLAKSGGTPTARMTRRASRLAVQGSPPALEQAVRDLAALRKGSEGGSQADASHTSQIVRHLIALGRLDEACAEADSLPTSGTGAVVTVDAIEALARALHEGKDPRSEHWLRRALELRPKGREHLELQLALVGELAGAGRQSEALAGLEEASAELDLLRKKTSKSTLVALTGGSGEDFAIGYWLDATNSLDALRKPVVGAAAAAAVAEGERALAEAQLLERSGDHRGARDAAAAAAERLSGEVKRLKPLVVGLSRSEAKEITDSMASLLHTLEVEHKRLKKLAKRT